MSGDGMSAFVSAITDASTGLTSANLWSEVTVAVPLIVAVASFALGFTIVRKLIKGAARGKLKM